EASSPIGVGPSTAHLLAAVILQLGDDGSAGDLLSRALVAVFERELKSELGEKRIEHFTSQRAHCVKSVAPVVIFEQDRRQRLRRRAANHARAACGIVFAVLRAAV